VTEGDWALLFHLGGVILLFSGMVVTAAALNRARRQEGSGEIAAVLGLSRVGVVLVALGGLVIVASGLWLIEIYEGVYSLGDAWIGGSLGLLVLAFVLGGIGGQRPKQARKLAARLAREGGAPTEELRCLLGDGLSRAFNYGAALAVLAALVVMVWKPGA
jgi:uncharacterized membrane protein